MARTISAGFMVVMWVLQLWVGWRDGGRGGGDEGLCFTGQRQTLALAVRVEARIRNSVGRFREIFAAPPQPSRRSDSRGRAQTGVLTKQPGVIRSVDLDACTARRRRKLYERMERMSDEAAV